MHMHSGISGKGKAKAIAERIHKEVGRLPDEHVQITPDQKDQMRQIIREAGEA
jgi:hypothetical protein